MSNPAQNPPRYPVIIAAWENARREPFPNQSAAHPGDRQFATSSGKSNTSRRTMLRQNRLRRLRASTINFFRKVRAIVTPEAREVRSQRMCPFCGLITPRHKRCCLECGKSLEPA